MSLWKAGGVSCESSQYDWHRVPRPSFYGHRAHLNQVVPQVVTVNGRMDSRTLEMGAIGCEVKLTCIDRALEFW
jgi:hypothetical protein